jgi:hypothetical protein
MTAFGDRELPLGAPSAHSGKGAVLRAENPRLCSRSAETTWRRSSVARFSQVSRENQRTAVGQRS